MGSHAMFATRTARQSTQEAYLALRQRRQWHALGGQLLTVHGSGPLQPFIDRNMIVERAMVQGRIRTNTVEAAGMSVCLGWHTHQLACVAASFRLLIDAAAPCLPACTSAGNLSCPSCQQGMLFKGEIGCPGRNRDVCQSVDARQQDCGWRVCEVVCLLRVFLTHL